MIKSLPRITSPNFLLSFDFDETLFDASTTPTIPSLFFELMEKWKREYGILWGINTGRALDYLFEDLTGSSQAPFAPDFTVTRERDIHLSNADGVLEPLAFWNDRCDQLHQELFQNHSPLFDAIFEQVRIQHPDIEWWMQEDDPYSIEVVNPQDLDRIEDVLKPEIAPYTEISFQRAGPYLRFCHADYNKGTALEQVVHLSGIPQNRVVLFGDGHNDLDAMIHLPEALCCCPANATPGVQQVVLQRRGHISSKRRSQGVLEILTESIEPWLKSEKIK
jgi:hypothetical protein